MIHYVQQFHAKFGLPVGGSDVLMPNLEAQKFRAKFLHEELAEFEAALMMGDRVKAFDALLDLAYVVYGTALYLGVDPAAWIEGMTAVHEANMSKVRATEAGQSKRGSTLDVIKPPGWQSPEPRLRQLLDILGEETDEV